MTLLPFDATEQAIFELQDAIFAQRKQLAELRRTLSPRPVDDWLLKHENGDIRLSQLFGNQDELILVHNMGVGCPYCTLWADGFNGVVPHLENRAAFALVSNDEPSTQQTFANDRGWKFKMVSAAGTTFSNSLGFAEGKSVLPGVIAFKKNSSGQIFLTGRDTFGPGDPYCSAWYLFNLLPEKPWAPRFQYHSHNAKEPS